MIFLAWDDWGGFFDHVVPPVSDLNAAGQRMGYGIRVPGLIISPWVKHGVIDHQTMSFDAYQRFIEDVFLDHARIGGFGGQRPDSRPLVRESVKTVSTQTSPTAFNGPPIPVGDLLNDFNFSQSPLPPLILPTNIPNNFYATLNIGTNPTTITYKFPLTWSPPANVTITGYNVYRTTTSGANYKRVPRLLDGIRPAVYRHELYGHERHAGCDVFLRRDGHCERRRKPARRGSGDYAVNVVGPHCCRIHDEG